MNNLLLIEMCLQYIPRNIDYNNWLKIISSVANELPENTAHSLLTKYFPDQKQNETWKKIQNRLKNVNIGTLIHLAKQHGFDYYKFRSEYISNSDQKAIQAPGSKSRKEAIEMPYMNITAKPEHIYEFDVEELNERSAIIEFSENISRSEADRIIFQQNKSSNRLRLFRASVNYQVLNKNFNPKTFQKYENSYVLTNYFKNELLLYSDLINVIGSGYSIIFAHLLPALDGTIRRNSKSFLESELLALDFDGGISIDEVLKMELSNRAMILYTTCSHSNEQNRFRLVFDLNLLFRNPAEYRKVVESFMEYYKFTDIVCKDVCRLWYGNNNAIIYDLLNGETIQYVNGRKI